jgi:hypothetical protein
MRCDATLVVPREKIEDKPKPSAIHEQNDEAKKEKPPRRREAIARCDTGDGSLTDIARSYVSHPTISRL